MMDNLIFNVIMAIRHTEAIPNATIGNTGYSGTRKGRSSPGSFFRSTNTVIIDSTYNVNAPSTEMVMISSVLPDSNATRPMTIFTNKAFAGVPRRGWIRPNAGGR